MLYASLVIPLILFEEFGKRTRLQLSRVYTVICGISRVPRPLVSGSWGSVIDDRRRRGELGSRGPFALGYVESTVTADTAAVGVS